MARCACCLWAAQDAEQPLETVERQRHLRANDGRIGCEHGEQKTVMIDATYLKAHQTATSMAAEKRGRGRLIGRTKGGINTKLHAICDSRGRPLDLFVTAGQVSDYIGDRALLSTLPDVDWLLGDRGYDADWFREALKDKGIPACIPGRKQRKKLDKVRQASLQTAQPDRDHVRQAEGLAARGNPLRQVPEGLPISHRPRSTRHLLAMSPEPRNVFGGG